MIFQNDISPGFKAWGNDFQRNILEWQKSGFTGFEVGVEMILRKNHLGMEEAWFCCSFVDYPVPPILLIATISCRTTTRISEDQRGRKNHQFPTERPRFLRHNKDGWLGFPKPTCFLHKQEIWPRGQREFSIPGILDESLLHFSCSTTRNDFLKSRSRLETRE